jgi:hypothetical protein
MNLMIVHPAIQDELIPAGHWKVKLAAQFSSSLFVRARVLSGRLTEAP